MLWQIILIAVKEMLTAEKAMHEAAFMYGSSREWERPALSANWIAAERLYAEKMRDLADVLDGCTLPIAVDQIRDKANKVSDYGLALHNILMELHDSV